MSTLTTPFSPAVLLAALLCPGAQAQALNASWEGDWISVAASQESPGARLRITRDGAVTRLQDGGKSCELAYWDTITPQALSQRIQALRAWQLDPAHWPAGTQASQLIGLAYEFDRAQAQLAAIAPGAYRRVRTRGPGCEGDSEAFFVLHRGQELVRLHFPPTSLGVAVASFRRQR